jgi:hypothetical protein
MTTTSPYLRATTGRRSVGGDTPHPFDVEAGNRAPEGERGTVTEPGASSRSVRPTCIAGAAGVTDRALEHGDRSKRSVRNSSCWREQAAAVSNDLKELRRSC